MENEILRESNSGTGRVKQEEPILEEMDLLLLEELYLLNKTLQENLHLSMNKTLQLV